MEGPVVTAPPLAPRVMAPARSASVAQAGAPENAAERGEGLAETNGLGVASPVHVHVGVVSWLSPSACVHAQFGSSADFLEPAQIASAPSLNVQL